MTSDFNIKFIFLFDLEFNNFNAVCCRIIMSEKKISEISQNEDDKKDYEAIEMLAEKQAEKQADSDHEKEPVTKNDSEKRVTLRRVFKLMSLNTA